MIDAKLAQLEATIVVLHRKLAVAEGERDKLRAAVRAMFQNVVGLDHEDAMVGLTADQFQDLSAALAEVDAHKNISGDLGEGT